MIMGNRMPPREPDDEEEDEEEEENRIEKRPGRARAGRRLDMGFREVVHSDLTEEAELDIHSKEEAQRDAR